MSSIVENVIKTLPFVKHDHVILCKLYQPHCWIWCRLKNRAFKSCLLEKLFDGDMNARNVYRTLEIIQWRDKEIGYFYVSDLARLLMPLKEHVEKMRQYYSEFGEHFLGMCLAMKDKTADMPSYRPLLTENVVAALPPLGSTAGIPLKQKKVICKFHIPGQYMWYVFEGEVEPEKGYRFFGMMEGDGMELKHFYLTELLALIEMGFPVQLDTSISNVSYHTV